MATIPAVVESDDVELAQEFARKVAELRAELHTVVVGQDRILGQVLTVLFTRGHALIIGVPGLAKTLLVKTLAQALGWDFKRIQFTPDLMPSDITGTEILQTDPETGQRLMTFVRGPLFANLILADEINRTPPKTQAALLEAMQELTVTAAGTTYPLAPPFFVLATQNPIEHEGTYPLPEAQLDRFMFSINIGYPERAEELQIVSETTTVDHGAVRTVLSKEDVLRFQSLVRRVPVSSHVLEFAVDLARATRPGDVGALSFVREYVEWGAGPRASQYLVLGAKANALLNGRPSPSTDDVRAVAPAVLAHRIIPNYKAAGEGITSANVIETLLKNVKEPDYKGR
ncbi:MAG TPA: MoxR family ATPase [Candidatus Hydrogenedentes bacterium]|nr:MoxR family ATPase [Candidatus Hydrogenedentota bacterium]